MRAPVSNNRQRVKPSLQERLETWLRILKKTGMVIAALAVIAGSVTGVNHLYEKFDVPIGLIGVDGELKHVQRQEVERIVAANLAGGFLSLDLDGIRQGLEAHPWVAGASARRKWPNELVITIEEETPIARWGEDGFLNNSGQVLEVSDLHGLDTLPLLLGPKGQSRQVMEQYRTFAQMLQPTGLRVIRFELGTRGNLSLAFDQGMTLKVGRGQVTEKLQRFLLVWQRKLSDRIADIEAIDIRYGNGVAVSWKNNSNA